MLSYVNMVEEEHKVYPKSNMTKDLQPKRAIGWGYTRRSLTYIINLTSWLLDRIQNGNLNIPMLMVVSDEISCDISQTVGKVWTIKLWFMVQYYTSFPRTYRGFMTTF